MEITTSGDDDDRRTLVLFSPQLAISPSPPRISKIFPYLPSADWAPKPATGIPFFSYSGSSTTQSATIGDRNTVPPIDAHIHHNHSFCFAGLSFELGGLESRIMKFGVPSEKGRAAQSSVLGGLEEFGIGAARIRVCKDRI